MKPLAVIVPPCDPLLVAPLVRAIDVEMSHRPWLLVHVTATPGGLDILEPLVRSDARLRVIGQNGGRGLQHALSQALARVPASMSFAAVITADPANEPRLLPELTHQVRSGRYDIAIASIASRSSFGAAAASRIARSLLPNDIVDPLSTYFVARRRLLEAGLEINPPDGLKAPLLPVLAATPSARTVEITSSPAVQPSRPGDFGTTIALIKMLARLKASRTSKAA